jgi:alkyldihydroxyacetonephosphate synthase
VYPSDEREVELIVAAATRHGVKLVAYGGGTNVTDALACDPAERRMIVSVDLSRMNRVQWVDTENGLACIEAGAVGRQIAAELANHGVTMGHEPDSVEFSTLGGWIATNASGMKKNRYGNIEDLVLDVRVVTASGVMAGTTTRPAPRVSIGPDPRRWVLGSEGSLGIITSAVVKVVPLPECQAYDSVLFPDFDAGFAFLRDLTCRGPVPASVRLVDNLQFQFSQKLKPRAAGVTAMRRRAERWFVTRVRGFDPRRMVACTLAHEGSASQVAAERATVRTLARRHGGLRAGADNGRKGYELTFSIAYLRDFIMPLWILGESFETSVPWNGALALCERVKARVRAECAARAIPGRPFVTCRITQLYQTGVAVYFYLGFCYKGLSNPPEVFAEIEHAARDEILTCGGSLSHHHGVGRIRREFLPRIESPAAMSWRAAMKRAIDPDDLFGMTGS